MMQFTLWVNKVKLSDRATWVAGEMKAAAADIAAVLRFCAPLGVGTKRSGEP